MTLILAALLLLQDKDGADLVRKAVEATKSQKSFEATFKARYVVPGSQPLDYDGRQVWVSPGILYMRLTGSGGVDRKVIRTGATVWIFGGLNGWLDAVDEGDDGVARGVQHPMDVLDILGGQAAAATKTKTGAIITLSGEDLKTALKGHVKGAPVAWGGSSAKIELSVDAEGRMKEFNCDSSLLSNDPKFPGVFKYSMTASLAAFNTATELKFEDENKRAIDLTPKIKERIAGLLEGGK